MIYLMITWVDNGTNFCIFSTCQAATEEETGLTKDRWQHIHTPTNTHAHQSHWLINGFCSSQKSPSGIKSEQLKQRKIWTFDHSQCGFNLESDTILTNPEPELGPRPIRLRSRAISRANVTSEKQEKPARTSAEPGDPLTPVHSSWWLTAVLLPVLPMTSCFMTNYTIDT